MTEIEDRPELSFFVASMTTRIDRHAAAYAHEVARYLDGIGDGTERPGEQLLLDSLNSHVEIVVASYDPPGIRRRGDSLVFAHVYAATRQPLLEDEELRRAHIEFLAALLAAEVEFRGPLRLSRTQNTLLAEIYERLGHNLAPTGLPAHAALAFRRAAGLHGLNEDVDAQDRCGLALARARTSARNPMWRRGTGWISDLLCGYGYRPFRLLGWIAAELLVFTVAVRATTDLTTMTAFHMCLLNFLNPVGLGDLGDIDRVCRTVLLVEAYAGTVSSSVFFALLVRFWFRL